MTKFKKLRNIISSFGVSIEELTLQKRDLLRAGLEFSPDDDSVIDTDLGFLEILPDGSVIRLLVHVPQKRAVHNQGLDDPKSWHKFHIFKCSTVKIWKKNMRKTTRDDGRFTYPIYVSGKEYKEDLRDGGRALHLCKNCLGKNQSLKKYGKAESFDIIRFFEEDCLSTSPQFQQIKHLSDFDLEPKNYPSDWRQISTQFKNNRNWICEECSLDLSEKSHRKYLHAHHQDRNPSHCSVFNLKALCIRCHAKEHNDNARFKKQPDYIKFVQAFPS